MTFDEQIDALTELYMRAGMCDMMITANEATERISRWKSLPDYVDTPWRRDRAEVAAVLRLQRRNWRIEVFIDDAVEGPCG